eukprot:gnl/TRDRNA2_/TRDRNA2_123432_c3_seq1.p1 gnl/TRDRNA2_/TRDRNA2_123432_c3~~gnl/TRDRNA2_/TRDRNA2_123432_c3_seq1.p1  ORF type:complete len:605 (+),score=57.51 gnl/TRDRNA2_/TRDRNA2_123432_c3_seq1:2-1816(+)
MFPLVLASGFLTTGLLSRLKYHGIHRCWSRRVGEISHPLQLFSETGRIRRTVSFVEHSMERKAKVHKHYIPIQQRMTWFWPMSWIDLRNAMLGTHFALFISFTKLSVSLLRWTRHGQDTYTVESFPDVLVYSDEWYQAIPVCILALLIYTLGFLVLVLWAAYVAPRRFAYDGEFRRGYRSLWAKFDPSAWWFCIPQLIYALMLNLVPVCTASGRLQFLNFVLTNAAYILLASQIRPWNYTLNNTIDLLSKCAVLVTAMLIAALANDPTPDEEVMTPLILFSLIVPLLAFVAVLGNFVHYHMVAVVLQSAKEERFAQRLQDVLKIVSHEQTVELKRYVRRDLHENDVEKLTRALDVLEWTFLKLQPQSLFRRRCMPVPFQVAVSGRLEGELIARGIDQTKDHRRVLRELKTRLDQKVKQGVLGKETHTHSPSGMARMKKGATHASLTLACINQDATEFCKLLDANGDGEVSKEDFVAGIRHYLGTDVASEDELELLYDHMDMNLDDTVSTTEFQAALDTSMLVVYPPGAGPESVQGLPREPEPVAQPEMDKVAREPDPVVQPEMDKGSISKEAQESPSTPPVLDRERCDVDMSRESSCEDSVARL